MPPASLAGVTIWGWGNCLGGGSRKGRGMEGDAQISPLFLAERPHHAHEKVRDEDLSQWDALVVMSGDGLLFEVRGTTGLAESWEKGVPGGGAKL